jgi:aminoglycoside phosphotransferase
LAQIHAQRPGEEALNPLIDKINKRCLAADDASLAYQFRQVTTDDLMSRVPSGDAIASNVIKLGEFLVVKRIAPELWMLEEAANIQKIAKMTSIPVPEIIRVHAHDRRIYLFMSFINGTTLEDLWPTLTADGKQNITSQLTVHMNELHKITPPFPCFFGSLEAHICVDARPVTRLNVGEHRLISFEEEFNEWLMVDLDDRFSQEFYEMLLTMIRVDHKIVLTHGDFHPRNIIVKDMVVTGIIDWEFAGWYPEHWEYIKALTAEEPVPDWWRYLGAIVGSYPAEWAIDGKMERHMMMRHTRPQRLVLNLNK